MRKFISVLCATAMTATSIGAGTVAAGATSVAMPLAHAGTAQVQTVQWSGNRQQSRKGATHRRGAEQRRAHQRRRFWRQGNQAYYNGYRGSRERRAGYRYHDGFWFPTAAFLLGAIIAGSVAQPQAAQPGRLSQAHVAWCRNRYVSYRLSDNSFQPYTGPRRVCVSPYG